MSRNDPDTVWPYPRNVAAGTSVPRWHCPEGLCSCVAEEKRVSFAFAVLLHDEAGERMPLAVCRVDLGGGTLRPALHQADDTGWVVIEVPHPPLPSVVIAWAPASSSDERYPYYCRYYVLLDDSTSGLRHRLANLGYAYGVSDEANVRAFERDYDLPITGDLNLIAPHLIAFHDMAQVPARRQGALTPSSPAVPAPAMAAYDPYGGGKVVGHGAVCGSLTLRRLRLADHEHLPAAGVQGEVRFSSLRRSFVADGSGSAEIWLPPELLTADIAWVYKGHNVLRERVSLFAADDPEAVAPRLHNLGYEAPSFGEQIAAYRHEHDYSDAVPNEVVAHDIRRWHDGGMPPHGAGSLDTHDFSGSGGASLIPAGGRVKRGLNTVCSNIIVDLFRDKSGWAPFQKIHPRAKGSKTPRNLWMLSLWKGQHSAVSFDDFSGADKIYSGNAVNAVPGKQEGAYFNLLDGKRRHLFFHGWYMGRAAGEQTSMLSLRKGCDIFQVRTYDWPVGSYGLIELYGKGLALNAEDVPVAYSLTSNRTISGRQRMVDIVKMVEGEAPLVHLVINAHGAFHSTEGRFVVELGRDGLHDVNNPGNDRRPNTVELFAALRGKVKFIWILSCACGTDNKLMSRLAAVTGAWVIGHGWSIENRSVPAGFIDWQLPGSPKVWNHGLADSTNPDEPISPSRLFLAARHGANVKDFEKTLDFNLIRVKKV